MTCSRKSHFLRVASSSVTAQRGRTILSDKADAVFASRFINGPSRQVVNFWQTTGTKLLTLLSNMCANTKLTDIGSGYNAFRASIIRNIQLRASSVLARSQKSQPNWHGRAAEFAKWVLARIAGMDKKVSQCDGAMRCGPSTRFSNTTFFARGPSPFPVN